MKWIVENTTTILTIGASIVIALIGIMPPIWSKLRGPDREPIPIKDIWAENREVTGDYTELRERHIALEDKYYALRRAFAIVWNYIEMLKDRWGSPVIPELSKGDMERIQKSLTDANL